MKLIPEPAYQQWGEHWWSGNQVAAMAARENELRRALRDMTAALRAHEWAEHVSGDPDIAALEAEITALVGSANASTPAALDAGNTGTDGG